MLREYCMIEIVDGIGTKPFSFELVDERSSSIESAPYPFVQYAEASLV